MVRGKGKWGYLRNIFSFEIKKKKKGRLSRGLGQSSVTGGLPSGCGSLDTMHSTTQKSPNKT